MAAQGFDKDFKICDRCFASVPADQKFCTECGADVGKKAQGEHNSDEVIYPQLAKANLLRMRGDYQKASGECLAILKRYPNNATANVLLGDICREIDDLPQAKQWYELGLDLAPGDEGILQKIASVEDRIKEKEAVEAAKDLGLPPTKSQKGPFVAAVVALVLIVAVAFYMIGSRRQPKPDPNETRRVTPGVHVQNPGDEEAPADQVAASPSDLALQRKFCASYGDCGSVLATFVDPRTKNGTVIFAAPPREWRDMAANLAKTMFEISPDTLDVNVRAMRGGSLVFTADVRRSRYNETLNAAWQKSAQPGDWVDYVLMDEWPVAPQGGGLTPPTKQESSAESDKAAPAENDNFQVERQKADAGKSAEAAKTGDAPANDKAEEKPAEKQADKGNF